ncbi:hypothetical protein Tco_0047560 [Tanacetum coccineum]
MELEYNFKECYKALTSRLDCNNPEGKEYLFDLSKPLPLIMEQKAVKLFLADIPSSNQLISNKLLLLFQKKLSNLERDVLFDLGVALRMFTRRIVILKRVEDLQLGVESYQKRLKITKPETFRSVLHDISLNLRMEYLPNRRWSNLNRQRSRIMIKAIDKMQLERSDDGNPSRANIKQALRQDDAQGKHKRRSSIPSSSISSDYAAKYLNFDNIPPVDVKVVSMLDINVQHEARPTTSTTVVPGSKTLIVLHQRVTDLEKDVKEHNIVDHSVALLSTIKYEVPNAVKEYLGISLDDALHKVLQKHSANITKEHYVPAEIVKRLRQQYVPEKTHKTSQKARWGMQESSKCLK